MDIECGGNADDRSYIIRYCFKLLGGAINWSNKRKNKIFLFQA
jgi:hypothetical protein